MKATLEDIRSGSVGYGMRLDLLPVGSQVSPRFGVTQNSKVRPIDDCTFSVLNSLHGAREKLQFQDVISILSICKCIITSHPNH